MTVNNVALALSPGPTIYTHDITVLNCAYIYKERKYKLINSHVGNHIALGSLLENRQTEKK